MVAPEKFEEDPTVDKRANDSRKQELYLPCCSPDDLLEKNVVEQMLLEVEQELERRVDELMDDGEREEWELPSRASNSTVWPTLTVSRCKPIIS